MRQFILILFAGFLLSCSSNRKEKPLTSTINNEVNKDSTKKDKSESNRLVASLHNKYQVKEFKTSHLSRINTADSLIVSHKQMLESLYESVPFYTKPSGIFYIVSTGKHDRYDDVKSFNGESKFGIVDDSLSLVLNVAYDKIYNPNLTLKGCFEIKLNDKVGLFNYETYDLLEPQFDFIIPFKNTSTNIAYGYKDDQWYEIKMLDITTIRLSEFTPSMTLTSLKFNIEYLGDNMMFLCCETFNKDQVHEGNGVVIYPSYLERFKGFSKPTLSNIIVNKEKTENIEFGIQSYELSIKREKNLNERLMSFFVSIYESGIGGRGYQAEKQSLIILDKENYQSYPIEIDHYVSGQIRPCQSASYQFINDSIIEVLSSSYKKELYDIETSFTYYLINSENQTPIKLSNDRHFSFTEFILIDESYFEQCFANFMKEPDESGANVWVYSHLSIEDLDIMRNEIFADYGYKFKTEKWKNYFGQKPWYKPRFDDVSDKLSETEKSNIKTILEMKEKMKGREKEYTQKTKATYILAG